MGDALGWPIKVEARPDSAMGRANAFVSPDRRTLYMRESLTARAALGDPKAVFDAVHELGHIVLHRPSIPLARMATRDNQHKFLQPEESAEHQANVFARSFLMTDEEVARYPMAEALSENCFTPLEEAKRRLEEYHRTRGRRLRKAERAQTRTDSVGGAAWGYERMPCPDCGNFTLMRSGACLTCGTCGAMSGCS